MIVSNIADLMGLRKMRGLPQVELQMDALLQGNLPIYAVKYALWALRDGGVVHLHAPTTVASVSVVTGRWAFQLLVMMACKAADGWGEVVAHDLPARRLSIARRKPVLPDGPWSAAVMYSGQDSEAALLAQCVESLQAQPGIRDGGQILVCGPEAASGKVATLPGVEYLPVETPQLAGRFLIGLKKNRAMQALRHERILVCHTRIALQADCLAQMPAEFDLITPRVWVQGQQAKLPYLDLGYFATDSASLFTRKAATPCHYDRATWLERTGKRYAYIDGGLFCARRSLALEVPLSDSIGWGEAEDSEWALRLIQNGHVVELAPDAHAESLTCKTAQYARWGHSAAYRWASNVAQPLRSGRATVLGWMGR